VSIQQIRIFLLLALSLTFNHCEPLNTETLSTMYNTYVNSQCEIEELNAEISMPKSFLTYEKEYYNALLDKSYTPVTDEAVSTSIKDAKVIVMSDNHKNDQSQQNTIRILKQKAETQPLTLVIEWIDLSFQPLVNQYLMDEMTLDELKNKINFEKHWPFSWDSYSRILKTAKSLKVAVLLVENLKEHNSLVDRDARIIKMVLNHSTLHKDMTYLIAYGTYHTLGKNHLRQQFSKHFEPVVTFVGNADKAFWDGLFKTKDLEEMESFQLGEDIYYLHSDSPHKRLEKERLYYLELLGYSPYETFCQ
jgi:hypothetical protein